MRLKIFRTSPHIKSAGRGGLLAHTRALSIMILWTLCRHIQCNVMYLDTCLKSVDVEERGEIHDTANRLDTGK